LDNLFKGKFPHNKDEKGLRFLPILSHPIPSQPYLGDMAVGLMRVSLSHPSTLRPVCSSVIGDMSQMFTFIIFTLMGTTYRLLITHPSAERLFHGKQVDSFRNTLQTSQYQYS
jgi:hypothetical protein